jgi:hypothetical protein
VLGFLGWRRILLKTKVVFSMPVIGMFELMILQNMLDLIILVDFDTGFNEK